MAIVVFKTRFLIDQPLFTKMLRLTNSKTLLGQKLENFRAEKTVKNSRPNFARIFFGIFAEIEFLNELEL